MVKRQGFKCSYSMLSLVAVLWTLAEYREFSLYLEDMDAREILEFCSFYVFFLIFGFVTERRRTLVSCRKKPFCVWWKARRSPLTGSFFSFRSRGVRIRRGKIGPILGRRW